jgi:16S rRNA (cytidine1402-2'-O)-methyltransferase
MNFKSGLYIVSTPIGNLEDITIRALDTLKHSNFIICEDTRVTKKLLTKYSIQSKLIVYNDHSTLNDRNKIEALIVQGNIVSIISDAGTPLISDPGYKLVRSLKEQGHYITAVPGPCSVIAGLTLSCLPSDKFYFGGFLPKTSDAKGKFLKKFLHLDATMIFFETSNRLADSLIVVKEVFGNRKACVARELTKIYEEANLMLISDLIEYYNTKPPKGEVVLLISGSEDLSEINVQNLLLQQKLSLYFKAGCSAKVASTIALEEFKGIFSKNEIYKIANQIKENIQ